MPRAGGAFLADRLVRAIRDLGIAHRGPPATGFSVVTVSAGYAGAG